ncbi:MAG: hypothetical protein JNK04_07205, partial [Myxococcales bacterium]|nr:hypothetical protein [Myxococcales bacterium]
MTTLLLLGVMALSFLLASGGSAWFCVGLAARLPLALARSSRVQAGLVLFPLAIGAFVAISLLSPMSLLSGCHCLAHPHHVHICFEHTALSAALACFALLGGAGALRSLVLWVGVLRGAMDTSDWSSRVDTRAVRDGVEVVPELGAHAITVGLWRPRVMVGASLWSSLDADGQRAVEAHEQAHVARRDILTLFCLRLAACALPARFGRHLLDRWRRAAEFACDRAAAQAIG